jgi:hypothetical protein
VDLSGRQASQEAWRRNGELVRRLDRADGNKRGKSCGPGLERRRNAENVRKKREAELIVHLDGEFFCLPADDLHDLEVQLLPRTLRVFRKLSPR